MTPDDFEVRVTYLMQFFNLERLTQRLAGFVAERMDPDRAGDPDDWIAIYTEAIRRKENEDGI